MAKKNRVLCAFSAALFIVSAACFCQAQTRALDDMHAELRANVRREMGLESYSSPGRIAARDMAEADKAPPPLKAGVLGQHKTDLMKLLLVVVVTAIFTALFARIIGGKKRTREVPAARKDDSGALEPRLHTQEASAKKLDRAAPGENGSRTETAIDIYEKIERLQALKDKGVLSEEEFLTKKKELLDRI
jgi:hypothetical protein